MYQRHIQAGDWHCAGNIWPHYNTVPAKILLTHFNNFTYFAEPINRLYIHKEIILNNVICKEVDADKHMFFFKFYIPVLYYFNPPYYLLSYKYIL